jgi:hypothetical protein
MKTTLIKKLQEQFTGKICTVLTVGIGKNNLQDHQFADFFTCIVELIEEEGIFTKHHITGCNNFYAMQFVVGIMEEQVIRETDPDYDEIIKEIKNPPVKSEPPPTILGVDPESTYINPAMLSQLSKQAQEFNKKMVGKNQP